MMDILQGTPAAARRPFRCCVAQTPIGRTQMRTPPPLRCPLKTSAPWPHFGRQRAHPIAPSPAPHRASQALQATHAFALRSIASRPPFPSSSDRSLRVPAGVCCGWCCRSECRARMWEVRELQVGMPTMLANFCCIAIPLQSAILGRIFPAFLSGKCVTLVASPQPPHAPQQHRLTLQFP